MKKKLLFTAAMSLSVLYTLNLDASSASNSTNVAQLVSVVENQKQYAVHAKNEEQLKTEMINMLKTYAPNAQITYNGHFDPNVIKKYIAQIYLQQPYLEGTINQISYAVASSGTQSVLTFNLDYLTTAEQENYVNAQIPKIIADIIKPDMNEFQKVKAIHDYIVLKTDYSMDTKASPHIPYTILTEGKGVCQAYALLAHRLLEEVDIEAKYVTGYVGNERHAWNMVKLDHEWYHVDSTWNDPVFNDGLSVLDNHIGYEYFLISDNQILKDHSIDERGYPKATSTKFDAFSQAATYLYATSMTFNRMPYFVNDKVYAFMQNGNTVDFSLYEADLTAKKLAFKKIPNISALTFVATESAIYYVKANTGQTLMKYNINTKLETALSNKKITDLYVENNVLKAISGKEVVYSERLRETSSAVISQLVTLADKLAVIDANFESNYELLMQLKAKIPVTDIPGALQKKLIDIEKTYKDLQAISTLPLWSPPKTITDDKKPWTIELSGEVKSTESNVNKIKVVNLANKELDVKIDIKGNKIIVTPNSTYKANTPYFLVIDKGLEDVNGTKTKKGVQLRFTFKQ